MAEAYKTKTDMPEMDVTATKLRNVTFELHTSNHTKNAWRIGSQRPFSIRSPSPCTGSALHGPFELARYPSSIEVTWLESVSTFAGPGTRASYPLALVLSRHRQSIPRGHPRRTSIDIL